MPEGSAWLPMAGIRARGAGAPGQAAHAEVGARGGCMCERGAPLQAASRPGLLFGRSGPTVWGAVSHLVWTSMV